LDVVAATAGSFTAERAPDVQRDSIWVHLVAAIARASDRMATADLLQGPVRDRFGPYRVVAEIGRGAMGVVYSAVDERTSRSAAVKTVTHRIPAALAAMRHEIAFLQRARHSGIVRIYEEGIVDGDPWYAMELLEGRTLATFNRSCWGDPASRRSSPPGPVLQALAPAAAGKLDEVLLLFGRMCAPLSFVHRAGIVHCDLKPSNVFVRNDDQPVLVDFGLMSRAGGAIGRETLEVGGLRGTLPYLAPELIRGQIPDARADIYAFGCMLYESLTGRPPFTATTSHDLLHAHLYNVPTPASHRVAGLPDAVDELLGGLLAKKPDERLGSAEIVAHLLGSMGSATVARPPPPSRTQYLFRPRLVGRDDIVGEVEDLARGALRGQGHFVLIGGESGIGKTFLASELARLLARHRFDVVTGECVALAPTSESGPQVAGIALEPFRGLLQRASDVCRTWDVAMDFFGSPPALHVLSQYEPALGHLFEGHMDPWGALPPPAERERAVESMRELIVRFGRRGPLLLVIDDLQWADDLSLAVLDSIAGEDFASTGVLVIGLYRVEEASGAISKLVDHAHVHSHVLERLDEAALTVMVGDMLARPAPPEVMRALADRAQGNPFFVAEYLRAAAFEGLLAHTAEGWTLSDRLTAVGSVADILDLPRSLRELLVRRLELLSAGARMAAEVASVLGREFRSSMLAEVSGEPESHVSPWLSEMLDRQLVERARGQDFRFVHDKIRELAYERLDRRRRSALHLAAGEALQREHAGGPNAASHHAEMAYHFRNGEAWHRAIDYFERAAENALRTSANADAVRFFREAGSASALGHVPVPAERRAYWARRIGDALQGLGDLSASKHNLLEAVRLLDRPMPESPARLALGVAVKLAGQLIHRTAPRRWVESDPRKSPALLEAARAYDRLTQIYYYRGEYGPLLYANLATLDLAERGAPSPTRAVGFTNAAATAGIILLPRVARAYFALAEGALREAYDPEVESYYQVLHGHYLSGLGDWQRASAAGDRVMQLAFELGFGRRWEEGAGLRCSVEWGRDFDRCLAWCNRMFDSAVRRNDVQTTSWGFLRRAEIHVARGEIDAAEESLQSAERLVPQLGLPEQIRAFALRAYVLHSRGFADRALAAADDASARIEAARAVHLLCLDPYARLAEVRLAAWVASNPRDRMYEVKARRSCQTLRAAARTFPVALPRYCLHEGTRCWLSGAKKRAIAIWERGRRAATSLQIPHEEALLTLALAQHNAASHDDAEPRARSTLARLGVHIGADAPSAAHQPFE
jgi:serine/threonine protein kinase/tetratricopeptide (TPR) repeat protein